MDATGADREWTFDKLRLHQKERCKNRVPSPILAYSALATHARVHSRYARRERANRQSLKRPQFRGFAQSLPLKPSEWRDPSVNAVDHQPPLLQLSCVIAEPSGGRQQNPCF